jgi:predicted lipoprotein with Yx(FWY)xxD motif
VNRKTYALALMGVLAVLIAGCGSSDSTSGGAYGGGETASDTTSSAGGGGYGGKSASSNSTSTTGKGGGAGVVAVARVGDLGTIIVNSEGMTLYDFHKDKGGVSSCYGACAGAWPPLLTEGDPKVEGGAMSNQLGTTKRKDGTVQVTYAGWPLYTYVGDKSPGEANGNDIDQFGAEWYALQPSGEEPED